MSAKRRRRSSSSRRGRSGSSSKQFAWLPGLMVGVLVIGGLMTGQINISGLNVAMPDFGMDPAPVENINPQLPDLGDLLPDPGDDDGGDAGDTENLGQLGGLNVGYTPEEALNAIDGIQVATSMATGYERSAFGSGWGNIRGTGCDARNVVLARDLQDVTFRDGTNDCVVLTGTLYGPFTGDVINFERGQDTSSAVQIDHIVPAAAAWRLGASEWAEDQRREWFNDLDNLVAVDGPTNGSKGDSTLGEWQPPNTVERCDYAAQYIYVIDKYDLALIEQDVTYARDLLPTC